MFTDPQEELVELEVKLNRPLHQQTTVQCPHPMNDLLQKAINKLHTSASEFYCVLRQLLLY